MRPIIQRGQDGERGAVAVIVSIGLVALLALVGLVVDGGNAFSQRRQMQNAADSAALAGANALQQYRSTTPKPSAAIIYNAARAKATENGAKVAPFTCDLVRYNATGTILGTVSCPTTSAGAVPSDAYKVRVSVESDHDTTFMRVVGADSFTARNAAAASVQKATISTAPFLVCANAPAHPAPLLIVSNPLDPDDASINPVAIGKEYILWGNEVKAGGRDCGNPSSSFRGLVDNDLGPFGIPGEWEADQGNKSGHIVQNLTTGCALDSAKLKDIPVGCEFALPLCLNGNEHGGNAFTMHCVNVGRFRISDNGNSTQATFLGGGVANGGGGLGIPDDNDLVVIKLSE
jgi:Flp pilus assembly protein TadG